MKKIKRLEKAQEYLNRAWNEFNTLANELDWGERKGDAIKYRDEIDDLLNCDGGEAGLEIWIERLKEQK